MRDPNRLDKFYEKLKAIHKEHFPDLRFGQLISNIQSQEGNDLFYYEEDKFLEALNRFVNKR